MRHSQFQNFGSFNKVVSIFSMLMFFSINIFAQGPKWTTLGNINSTGDFIGSTNFQPLVFKTNNIARGEFTATGNFQLNNLSGIGNRLLQTDASGNIIPFAMGTNTQVLYGNGIWGSLPTPPVVFWNSSGSNIYYNTGNVGIGTTTPLFPLDVIGDVRISNNLYVGGGIVISDKVNANAEVITGKMQADSIVTDSTKGFYGTSKFNGDVKLQNKLSVNGDTKISGIMNITSLASGIPLQMVLVDNLGNLKLMGPGIPGCAGTMPWLTGGNAVGTLAESFLGTCNSMPLILGTNTFEQMRITPGGRIGIGTSIPSTQFEVAVPSGFTNSVGIGIAIPDASTQLNIVTNKYGIISQTSSQPSQGYNILALVDEDNTKAFAVNSTGATPGENFVVYGNGTVSIGTNSMFTDYKLSVNGNIRAKKVVVDLGWSDFVFEDNYKLMPLSDVELFYSANGHLPNIPSAKEIESNGGDVSELLKLQMQKIEELTIYIVEQNKRIVALEKAK